LAMSAIRLQAMLKIHLKLNLSMSILRMELH
jgi:hypothetical protein